MTLLNAPQYNASREATKRNVLVGSGIAILLIAILAVAGFVTGHGVAVHEPSG